MVGWLWSRDVDGKLSPTFSNILSRVLLSAWQGKTPENLPDHNWALVFTDHSSRCQYDLMWILGKAGVQNASTAGKRFLSDSILIFSLRPSRSSLLCWFWRQASLNDLLLYLSSPFQVFTNHEIGERTQASCVVPKTSESKCSSYIVIPCGSLWQDIAGYIAR